jgi:hypothetical protein
MPEQILSVFEAYTGCTQPTPERVFRVVNPETRQGLS